jgi:hypothetical protein
MEIIEKLRIYDPVHFMKTSVPEGIGYSLRIKKPALAGFSISKEPRLLYVSFFVPLVSGHRPG